MVGINGVKINMNKYQKALNNVKRVYVESEHYDEEDIRLLQELVDKATPKKPKRNVACDKTNFYYCSKCNTDVYIGMKYCCECGQALDWNDEDD